MLDASTLVHDGRLIVPAIQNCHCSSDELSDALNATTNCEERAALALLAHAHSNLLGLLLSMLSSDALDGQTAAWALGHMPCEDMLFDRIKEGGIDQRSNAWAALAYRIIHSEQSGAQLISGCLTALDGELAHLKKGRSALGELACRTLVLLQAPQADEQIQRVIAADRFCDRYELQRLRKVINDESLLAEERNELSADWTTIFADYCSNEMPASAEELIDEDDATENSEAPLDEAPLDKASSEEATEHVEADEQLNAINWQAFLESDEAASIPQEYLGLLTQIGPAFEQLAARAFQKALADCSGDEIAMLFLQVLPQAAPPQVVQLAVSPQGLNQFKALIAWLNSQEADSGAGLAEGIQIVREQIQAQMRASGNLNSSIYDDADEQLEP